MIELTWSRRRSLAAAVAGLPWILIGTVCAGALNYVYALCMTALLSPGQYSVFASGQAVLLITGTVANTAVPWLLAREIASDPVRSERSGAVFFALVLNLLGGLLAGVISAGLALSFAAPGVAIWIGLATLTFFLGSTGMGWAQGHERFSLLALLIVGEVAVKVIVGAVMVSTGWRPAGAFAGAVVGAVALLVIMLKPMWTELRPRREVFAKLGSWLGALGSASVPAAVTALSVADVLFVALRFGTGSQAAGYQVAAALARTPLFIALAYATEMFPTFAKHPGDPRALSDGANRMIRVLAPLMILLITIPGHALASVLPGGYQTAGHLLTVTPLIGTAYAVVIWQTSALRAAGALQECFIALGFGSAVSVAGMFIGATLGITGMAVGAAIGGWVTVAALAMLTERRWPGAQRPDLRPLAIWLCAGGAMFVARSFPAAWLPCAAVVTVLTLRAALTSPRVA